VFVSGRDGPFSLYVMGEDGSAPRRLTWPPAGESDARPAVSPDGRRVVFNRTRGEQTIGILVLEL
jgi:Tol biopolymer transport system component